jgi:hypothetical protein
MSEPTLRVIGWLRALALNEEAMPSIRASTSIGSTDLGNITNARYMHES